jgi:hypothetical protein
VRMQPTNQGVGEKQWFSTRCLEKQNYRWRKHTIFVSTACEIAWTIDILHLCLHPRKKITRARTHTRTRKQRLDDNIERLHLLARRRHRRVARTAVEEGDQRRQRHLAGRGRRESNGELFFRPGGGGCASGSGSGSSGSALATAAAGRFLATGGDGRDGRGGRIAEKALDVVVRQSGGDDQLR